MSTGTIVSFDYEGAFGMPFDAPYQLQETTQRILEVLEETSVQAVFFVVGELALAHPELIRTIVSRGHTIGLHGIRHEHLHCLNANELTKFGIELQRLHEQFDRLGLPIPTWFRAPYLMGPRFYEPRVYAKLAAAGYKFASNCEIRRARELFRPDRIPQARHLFPLHQLETALEVPLNQRLLRANAGGQQLSLLQQLQFIANPQPFQTPEGLTEIPLSAPLDCDLLGFPVPNSQTPPELIEYATSVYVNGFQKAHGTYMLSFHDWIIGTSNRLEVLRRTLTSLQAMSPHTFHVPRSHEFDQIPAEVLA